MPDAIELLLQDKRHRNAQDLLAFHRDNRDFLARVVAEMRLLIQRGRKEASVRSLFHFLRWHGGWQKFDAFEVNDGLAALAIRVCILFWPDINGMARLNDCTADEILHTRIVHRKTPRNRDYLCLRKGTPSAATLLSPQERDGGLVRPIQLGISDPIFPPKVEPISRPVTFHPPLAEAEAACIVEPLQRIAARSTNSAHPRIRAWTHHFVHQPEIFAFVQGTLRDRQPEHFSAWSLLEYARWSIDRAALSHKRFSLRHDFGGLYSRALVAGNPEFNGKCEFRDFKRNDGNNELLGCSFEPEPRDGERYRRLIWPGVIE